MKPTAPIRALEAQLDQLFAEAALTCPDIDLVEWVRVGAQALEMAADCSIDPPHREVARQLGLDVSVWLLSIIDSARARQGARPF